MTDRELRPVGRFEWEQIICRARLGGLIAPGGNVGKDGRPTKGGVSGSTFKAVALVWATHADPDGSRIYPGDATLAVEAEVSLKVAQAVKAKLVELGLTERVRAGSRRHRRGDEYRLTLPTNLLDVLEVLSPAALKARATAEYEKRRGKRGGPAGTPIPGLEDATMGGPPDTPQDDQDETCGGPAGPTDDGYGGPAGPHVGGPPDRDTTPDRATNRPTPADDDLRTDAATSTRGAPDQDHDSSPLKPSGCPHHGPAFAAGTRPDGKPACPFCRRGAPPIPATADRTDDDPEADEIRAKVRRGHLALLDTRTA